MRAFVFIAALVATVIGIIVKMLRGPAPPKPLPPPEVWSYRTTPGKK
jgi:hypothetical protein